MSPQMLQASRLMRVVVLLVFVGIMVWQGSTVSYLFGAVCAFFLLVTSWQLWSSWKGGE